MIKPDWASDVQYSGIFLQGSPFFLSLLWEQEIVVVDEGSVAAMVIQRVWA